jgi:hypothetical protein
MTSRKVALTAAFLALAAGGTAACDSADDDWGSDDTTGYSYDTEEYPGGAHSTTFHGTGSTTSGSLDGDDYVTDDSEESTDEVFYCADEDGEIVDEELCADGDGGTSYFLWHSSGYDRGLSPGTVLDDGEHFPAGDRAARRAFKLPAAGAVSNGTVKTNVVGRSSGGNGIGGSSGG